MSVTYDDQYNFLRFRPVGPATFEEIDAKTSAVLIHQDYVKKSRNFVKPPLGLHHHQYRSAILVKVNTPSNIGGGLLKFGCVFVMNYQAQYIDEIQRSVTVPGIKTSSIQVREKYLATVDLPFNEWEYEFTTVSTREGDFQEVSRVVKTEDEEQFRTFSLPQVTLREPTTLTLTCTQTTSYGVTCSPMGRAITDGSRRAGFKGFSRNVYTPTEYQKTTIYSSGTKTYEEEVDLLIKERVHPKSIETFYDPPSISSRTISEYLTDTSSPNTSEYFELDFIQAESTIVEPIIGALNRYIDIRHRPI